MTTEDRQLSDMLHRVTPEPPRPMTVEDVGLRLASQAGRRRRPRAWRPVRSRGWAPVLAAVSVFAVAGASAGIAEVMTSHHGPSTGVGSVVNPSSASPSGLVSSSAEASASGTPTGPTMPPKQIVGAPWGAELIFGRLFPQGWLVGRPNSLYAMASGIIIRIDPHTGNLRAMANSGISDHPDRPVITGNTMWVLVSYSGSSVELRGYDGTYLQEAGSVTVPVSGQVSTAPEGALATGPGGMLYVAAGNSVAVVNPGTRQVIKQISVSGLASSVAVSPDGSKLYVGTARSRSFQLLTYDPTTGAQLASSAIAGIASGGGNLVATSGGVWGTIGVGMTEQVWFAPGGDLTRVVWVSQGVGAGQYSVPSLSGGTIWIGGTRTLVCADPATGQVRASAAIPTDNGVVEYFSSVTVTGGKADALYLNQAARQAGIARLTPPAACG